MPWGRFPLFGAVSHSVPNSDVHRLSKGWTMMGTFSRSVPQCGIVSHWGQNLSPYDYSVLSLRRDGCCPLARTFPRVERKISEASHSMFSTWRTLWCRCGFFRPICNYWRPSSHVEWWHCRSLDLGGPRHSMLLCARGRPHRLRAAPLVPF